MTDTNVNLVTINMQTTDSELNSNIENNNSAIYSQSVEMRIDNSYLSEVQRLQVMFRCQVSEVFKTDECKDLMNFLRHFSSSILTEKTCIDITEVTDNDNCIEFFRSYIIIAIDNCSQMLNNISQRQFINLIKFVMAIWNMSDKYDSLCTRMVSCDVHVYLIRLLGKMQITPDLLEIRQILLLSMSIVGILHNINRKLHDTRATYRKENLVKYLMPIAALEITKDLVSIKTAALLLLAFLVNENENEILNAKDDHIIYILDILKTTVTSPELYSIYYGYHCLEILHSLRHIASPDSNKRSLIANGILSLIGMVLQVENEETYPEEITAALDLLWSLSFSKDCLLALDADGCELKNRVEKLALHQNQTIILSARGILWNLNNSQRNLSFNNLIRSDARTPNINGHIMISYQHSTQDVMIKVKNSLINVGYRVWMDVDHMRGSFVDAMAEGIQHAAVLVLGICQAFKNSPHCRQEVKYAYTLGIPLVPIMLEPCFAPDGWLGLMCATLIHTEFIDQDKFDLNMMQLQRQLGSLGHSTISQLSNQDSLDDSVPVANHQQCNLKCCEEILVVPEHTMNLKCPQSISNISDCTDNVKSYISDHSSFLNAQNCKSEISSDRQHFFSMESRLPKDRSYEKSEPECSLCIQSETPIFHWTKTHCNSWFIANQIPVESIGAPLMEIDGSLLLELADMRIKAPETFFKLAKEELNLDFIQMLKLSRALRSLEKLF